MDGGGVLVHGYVSLNNTLHLKRWMELLKYINILKEQIIPYLKTVSSKCRLFSLTSRATKDYMKNKLTTIKWPAHSPDFSLIEPC